MLEIRTQQTLSPELSSKTIPCGVSIRNLKKQLKTYFLQTYNLYEKLFTVIKEPFSYYTKPQPLRHPLIFYFGHTAAFFVNKLIDKGLIKERINESYERMFAVGVDEIDWDDLNDSHYDWPSLQDSMFFREQVKEMVLSVIENSKETSINWNSDLWIILMGIQHERIHLETSSVIIRRLPIDEVYQPEWFKECPHSIKEISKIPVNLLKSVKEFENVWDRERETATSYGWDNEFGHKTIKTVQFKASQMLVSNGEFYEFYSDKGYQNKEYWSDQGQNWLKSTKVSKPIFWQVNQQDGTKPQFYLRTITSVIEMPWDWTVEVNNLQAQAFCKWKSQKTSRNLRLPSEDEYFALRNLLSKDLNEWKHGQVGNINLEYWMSPNPIDMFETKGFFDIVGNVWQHTVTSIHPFEGFEIHPVYEDFTTPTFDNRHNLIKGGSFISTGNQALYHSRYAFRRHFYQHAGFRYVESQNSIEVPSAEIDQSDQSVENALITQFVDKESYIEKMMSFIRAEVDSPEDKNSLVVGCSVGRLPLQLSDRLKSSYGIDYTARYFQMATRLLQQKKIKYQDVEVNLNTLNLTEINYEKVQLYQMNPENPDSKKINEIDLLIVDGNSLRKNTLGKVVEKCLNLCNKVKKPQVMIISNSLKNPEKDAVDFLRKIGFRHLQQKILKAAPQYSEEIKVTLFI